MSYKYPDHIISMVKDECRRISLLNTTPRKYSVNMFQASEIICQLENKIESLKSELDEYKKWNCDDWDLVK